MTQRSIIPTSRPRPTLFAVAALALALGLGSAAQASPVMYSLDDVVFTDGATAAGTFALDPVDEAVSDVAITLAGTPQGTRSFDVGTFLQGQQAYDGLQAINFSSPNDTNDPLVLYVQGDFATTNTVQPLIVEYSDGSATFYCSGGCNYVAHLDSGATNALVASVPEPMSAALLGSGLVGVAALRRRYGSPCVDAA